MKEKLGTLNWGHLYQTPISYNENTYDSNPSMWPVSPLLAYTLNYIFKSLNRNIYKEIPWDIIKLIVDFYPFDRVDCYVAIN